MAAVAPTIANIIGIASVFINIALLIVVSIQTNNTKEQTVTAREAAKVADDALCQTLETGLNVVELTQATVLKGFVSPLSASQRAEYAEKSKIQEAYFKRLYAEHDCPPRLSE